MCFLGLINPLRHYMVNEAEISTEREEKLNDIVPNEKGQDKGYQQDKEDMDLEID